MPVIVRSGPSILADYTFPLAPRLFSFPFFSPAPSLFLSIFPSLMLVWAQKAKSSQIGKIPGTCILRVYRENPGSRVYLANTRYVAAFLGFASDFAPDQLSDCCFVRLRETRARVARMEHHTSSLFPGNFRERKVLGTIYLFSFLFANQRPSELQ